MMSSVTMNFFYELDKLKDINDLHQLIIEMQNYAWCSIDKGLPETKDTVWLGDLESGMIFLGHHDDGVWFDDDGDRCEGEFTHWQRVPLPPTRIATPTTEEKNGKL